MSGGPVAEELLGAILDMLADRLAARVLSAPQRERYDSRQLPPNTTRRRFAEICRGGRVSDAKREGQTWSCTRTAWEAARAAGIRRRPPEVVPERGPLDHRAHELLARAGLRLVSGERRK
jgi:hypothetical protein